MKNPELKPGTLRALERELTRARHRYPSNRGLYDALTKFMLRFDAALYDHTTGIQGATASNVYELGLIVATLALRLVEEGDAQFRYANHEAPQVQTDILDMLELTNVANPARYSPRPHSFLQNVEGAFYCNQITDTSGTKCNKDSADYCRFYACPHKSKWTCDGCDTGCDLCKDLPWRPRGA